MYDNGNLAGTCIENLVAAQTSTITWTQKQQHKPLPM